MNNMARVVIVGRMNVGKSTLFNRLATSVKSITFDYPGVTRDIIKDVVTWQGRTFELIDTGGITMQPAQTEIAQHVKQRADQAVTEADVVIFMLDGSVGILPQDQEMVRWLHKLKKPLLCVVNKADTAHYRATAYEYDRLGCTQVIPISATHGTNIDDLLQSIVQFLPAGQVLEAQEPAMKIVLLGKPNVGKSSLMNQLLNQERSIVSAEPGTTREPISERVRFYQEDILVTDTAGIRRKRAVSQDLEQVMVRTSFKALERADIVLLLIDASAGVVSDQELKLAFYAFEEKKAVIVLFNKQDLVTEQQKESLAHSLLPYKHLIKKLPQLSISCVTGKNVGKIMPLVTQVWQRYNQKFNDTRLHQLFKEALNRRPLYHKTNLLAVYNTRQIRTAPVTIALTVNEPLWFGESQLGYFENVLRKQFDLLGVPVKWVVYKRKSTD